MKKYFTKCTGNQKEQVHKADSVAIEDHLSRHYSIGLKKRGLYLLEKKMHYSTNLMHDNQNPKSWYCIEL